MTHTPAQHLARSVLYQYDGELCPAREALRTRQANAQLDWPMSPNVFARALFILKLERKTQHWRRNEQ